MARRQQQLLQVVRRRAAGRLVAAQEQQPAVAGLGDFAQDPETKPQREHAGFTHVSLSENLVFFKRFQGTFSSTLEIKTRQVYEKKKTVSIPCAVSITFDITFASYILIEAIGNGKYSLYWNNPNKLC